MKNFVVYLQSGQIIRSGACQEKDLEFQAGDGESILEVEENKPYQYVANGQLIDMPPKPSENYFFDYDTKQWVFDTEKAINDALQKRYLLLKDGPDRISPIWYDSMTQEEKNAWADYRQALLDITSQPDYPNDIIWPIKPSTGG